MRGEKRETNEFFPNLTVTLTKVLWYGVVCAFVCVCAYVCVGC